MHPAEPQRTAPPIHRFTNSPEERKGRSGPRNPGDSADLGQVERKMLLEKEAELATGGGKESPWHWCGRPPTRRAACASLPPLLYSSDQAALTLPSCCLGSGQACPEPRPSSPGFSGLKPGRPSSPLTHQAPTPRGGSQPCPAALLSVLPPDPPRLRPTHQCLPCCSLEPPAAALCPCLSGDADPEKRPTS